MGVTGLTVHYRGMALPLHYLPSVAQQAHHLAAYTGRLPRMGEDTAHDRGQHQFMGLWKKSGGGGFLSGVSGTIAGYQFTSTEWPAKNGKAAYSTVTAELSIMQDDATEPVAQFLKAGFLRDTQSISADGLTLEGEGEGIPADTEFARFVQSMVDQGFPEDKLSMTNFEAIIGTRVTFEKERDEVTQLAVGRKRLGAVKARTATHDEIMEAGKRADRKDPSRTYNLDVLVVSAILALPAEKGGKRRKAAPATATTKAAKGGKPNGAIAPLDPDALLVEVLTEAKDQVIPRGNLASVILRAATANGALQEERNMLYKLICSEEFLARENGWSYDPTPKTQPVTLAA